MRWCLAGLLMLAAPATIAAQRGTLSGAIVSRETKEPLAYSIVALPALGRESFTTDSGAFTFGDLPVGPLNEFHVVRIDIVAADRITEPDVEGSLYLDQDTFQIRRSALHLTRMPNVYALQAFDVTTDFEELMESIPVIYRVFTIQSFDTSARRRDYDAVYEDLKLQDVKFLGRKPGQDKKAP